MARKPDLKPNHSSSSDAEEEKEEEVSGSEDEQTSEEEVSADSESDSEPKPKHEPKKQPASKGKRPSLANENEKDPKKAKKSDDDSKKKQPFKRVWSEEDEIIVLKGMIDCKTEDMGAVHDFIKNSLHDQVSSRTQFLNKVKKLKKKYVNNAKKEKNGKKGFSNSHEQEVYELSKIIWGSETEDSKKTQTQKKNGAAAKGNATGGASSSTQKNGVGEKEGLAMEVEKNMDVSQFVCYGGMSYSSPVMEEEIVKAGWELVEGAKREELNEKLKKFKVQELQLYVQRLHLIKERAQVVLEAMLNSSGN